MALVEPYFKYDTGVLKCSVSVGLCAWLGPFINLIMVLY